MSRNTYAPPIRDLDLESPASARDARHEIYEGREAEEIEQIAAIVLDRSRLMRQEL